MLVAILLLLFSPLLTGNTYYRVIDAGVAFRVPAATQELIIGFRGKPVSIDQVLVTSGSNDSAPAIADIQFLNSAAAFAIPESKQGSPSLVRLQLSHVQYIDITGVQIDGVEIDLSRLPQITTPPGAVHRTIIMREELSNILFELNESAANLALTFLSLVLIGLIWQMGRFALRLCSPLGKFKSKLDVLLRPIPRDQHVESRKEAYLVEIRRFNFWKVIGPVIGFILTVTSLSAALHPSLQTKQDAYMFISAVQVAVISTAIGLVVRLCAHLCLTLRQSLLRREVEYIAAEE